MQSESPSNENNKSKRQFGGRRRSYVDSFRWGFVSEEEESGKNAPHPSPKKPEPKQPDAKRGNTKKVSPPAPAAPTEVAAPDSPSPSKRNRQRKKTVKTVTTEATAKPQSAPKGKSGGNKAVKLAAKTPAGHLSKPSPPGKHPPKGKERTKAVPPYDENDDDLKLPSYGRTPIPTDDELPLPQRIPKKNQRETKAVSVPAQKPAEAVIPAVAPDVYRPRKEQMVWDPDRLAYVPLVIKKETKPEPAAPKKQPPKQERPAPAAKKPEKRQEQVKKPAPQSAEKPKTERLPSPPKPQPAPRTKPERSEGQRSDDRRSAPPKEERSPQPESARQSDSRRSVAPQFVAPSQPDPADIEAEVSGFAELGVSEAMLEALKIVRYLEPTPIQKGVFQKVQAGVDLMGQAQTGTGKTAAFSMPIIEGVETCPPGNSPVALILVPTRELAVQVRDEAMRLAYNRDVRITACYGGKPLAKQIERLKQGIDILIGTPGRILDLMRRMALSLDSLRWVVLDEADRMLDIGFRPDIEKILRRTPQDRQTLLFSATLPPPVVRLAERYMKTPEVLDFSNKGVAVETIDQFYVTVDPERKFDALVYLLEEQQPQQAIIFTRTKRGADRLARLLARRFDKLAAIHGDLQQNERDRVMAQVRAGSIKYLVATDVVGRGIDVSTVSHIINYDIPKFCDDYIHRVGRTGRMGRDGVAFTFVTVQEGSELTRIEMRIDKLLKRAELKGFESFTKPHDPNASLDDESPPEPPKPVFGKPVRKVRRAL
ncbi:MAG: DEAD/DEAH box helicase [Planctomycetaceae bacterium]|jgi:ATP-dependent RNA helicase DeaD|nr:DEAD/DEAH box helicase [Planctomycetaceae bacterium]